MAHIQADIGEPALQNDFLISGVWLAFSPVGPEDRSFRFRNRRPRTEQAARPLEVEAMVSPIY